MVSLGQNVLLGRRLTALQGGSIVALENKEALKPDNLGVYLAPLFTGYMTLGNSCYLSDIVSSVGWR